MARKFHHIFAILLIFLAAPRCKEPYLPSAIQNNVNLLVIDGTVVSGNGINTITLSKTKNLNDFAPTMKVTDAQVSVISVSGVEYNFVNLGDGRYQSENLLLDSTQQYQLKVVTTDGNEFRSAVNSVRSSPPIDSVQWVQDTLGVQIYVNSSDPSNNTKYYRWTYEETWQYESFANSTLEYNNGDPILRPVENQIYNCWLTQNSSTIEVYTTSRLSSDLVYKYPLALIPTGSEKLSKKFSILVKQYALSQEAYNFWENLKKNTEELGTIFDLQPFTELGNIRCVNNPSVKCIGYISFTTAQESRIFIDKREVFNWNYYPYYGACARDTLAPDALAQFFQPPGGPYFSTIIGTDNGAYIIGSVFCVDCTYHGGVNVAPAFWQ